jgi:hypothetical protein
MVSNTTTDRETAANPTPYACTTDLNKLWFEEDERASKGTDDRKVRVEFCRHPPGSTNIPNFDK